MGLESSFVLGKNHAIIVARIHDRGLIRNIFSVNVQNRGLNLLAVRAHSKREYILHLSMRYVLY